MTTERKKNGRPEKSAATKKSERIVFRTTKAQANAITTQAQQMGLTVSEYCHVVMADVKVIAPFTEEELQLKRGLVGMANNLNQLAFRANAAGATSVELTARELFQKIRNLLKKYNL